MRKRFIRGNIYVGQGEFTDTLDVVDGRITVTEGMADETIDLQGATVVPGFNDSHLHLLSLGNALSMLSLNKVRSVEELIEQAGAVAPEQSLIEGRGWNQDYFSVKRLPTLQELDSISTERPVYLSRACGHIALVNSKAFELAGINEKTPDPPNGRFVRDADGHFTGEIQEMALSYLRERLPMRSAQEDHESLLTAIDHVLAQGVTSVQSNDIDEENYTWLWPMLREISLERALRIHEQLTLTDETSLQALEQERKLPVYGERLSLGPIKVFKDGSLGGRTAHLKDDYQDDPGNRGVSTFEQDAFIKLCQRADAMDMPLICHAIGDQAIQEVLDAFRVVNSAQRNGIVHCQITDRDLLDQLIEDKPMVYYQPIFLTYDMHIAQDRVGAKAQTSYAFATLYRAGVPVGFGTDCPVEDSNPFENIYCAVTRRDLSGQSNVFFAEECMSVQEAIDAYTYGSAYLQGMEAFKGLLQPGCLADFVVLDRDIFTVAPEEIRFVNASQVYVGGNLV